MSKEDARKIMKALSHVMGCPFSGCTCGASVEAQFLYAEAARVVRESQA